MEFVHPYDNYDKAELEWFRNLRPYEMLKFMKTEPEKYKKLMGIMARKHEMAVAEELLRRETENYINQLNKERKTVKLKSIPKHIDELLEVTDKPIRLRKTIKLKSNKKISQDIDKLLKEVDAIVKKQKKGALTITQVRSEIFNRVLKEADKQHNAGVLSDSEYVMVVKKLNEGDLKTAEDYIMGPSQIKEMDKLIKQLPKPLKLKKAKKTAKEIQMPVEITEEYLLSLPRTKKGTVSKASKEFKALPVDKKILAINLTKQQPKRSSFAEEMEQVEIDDDYLMNLPKTKTGLISRASKQFKALTKDLQERAFSLSNKPRTEAKKTKQAEARAKLTARNKADKQSGQSKIINSGKTLEEAKAYIEAKKKALEEKKKAEASKPSAIKETEAKLKTDLRDFAMAIRRLPEISAISKLTEKERYSAKNALSDAFSNKRVVSETIKQIKHNKSLPEERILELMDVYDAVQNIELLKKYKELI